MKADNFSARNRSLIFWCIGLAIVVVRLASWKGKGIPLVDMGVDDNLYLDLAKNWYWNRNYDRLSIVRPPAFPLWIALVNFVGLPLAISLKALYLSGGLMMARAGFRLSIPTYLVLAVLGLFAFQPTVLPVLLRITPDGFYACIAMHALAQLGFYAASDTLRKKNIHASLFGFLIGVLILTRDEYLIAVGILLLFIVLYLLVPLLAKSTKPIRIESIGLLILCCASPVFVVLLANKLKFDALAISQFTTSGYNSMYKAALSVDREKKVKGVPITLEALDRVYEISPSWRSISDDLNAQAKLVSRSTAYFTRDPEEIGAGAFPWVMLNVVSANGYFESQESAERFLHSLGDEITEAQKAGLLGSRNLLFSLVDPDWKFWLPDFFISMRKALSWTFLPKKVPTPYYSGTGAHREQLASLYRDTTMRPNDPSEIHITHAKVNGWIVKNHDTITEIRIEGAGEPIVRFTDFKQRADVYDTYKAFEVQMNSAFEIEMDLTGEDPNKVTATFESESGKSTSIPLANFVRQGSGTINAPDWGNSSFFIDQSTTKGANPSELAYDSVWNLRYAIVVSAVGTLSAIIFFSSLVRKRTRYNWPMIIWLISLIAWYAGRTALAALVDATAFPLEARYVFSSVCVLPWILVALSSVKQR